jgi:nucleoside-diphosphate-sugar epimerase
MAGQRGSGVRRGRSGRTGGRVVAVTGAAGPVGQPVAARLLADERVRRVVALDTRRGDLDGVQWRVLDLAAPPPAGSGLADRLGACDAVVHCASWGDPSAPPAARRRRTLDAATALLDAAAQVGARRVAVLSSATVYGALPGAPVPLDEDAPLLAVPADSPIGDLLALEQALAGHVDPPAGFPAVTPVRPALTAGPGVDGPLARHFDGARTLVVKGTRPLWQFCHVDDLASALAAVVLDDVAGAVTVGCDGWLTQDEVEHLGGLTRVELPAALALGTADRLHRLGITRAPASELAYAMHPWVVPSTRIRAAGWRPLHDNVSALQALLTEAARRHSAGHRPGTAETATLGAAGATVAVLGAAAVVRRSRRRRRG